MKIDILYDQLHSLIETVRFSGRMVLAMGSEYNVQLMAQYLKCYGLEFAGVLDNDVSIQGTWRGDYKIFSPEEILIPFKEKALILIFSPQYGYQMGEQLEKMGYEENKHFFIISDFRQLEHDWAFFEEEINWVKKGYQIYSDIVAKYGHDTNIFLLRGATGDVFLNGLYLERYAEKMNMTSIVLVGDAKGLRPISALFGIENVVSLDFLEAESFQRCYRFLNIPNIKDVFMWQGSLYLNRCQARMHKEFTFLDTYTYYLYQGLVSKDEWKKPKFSELTDELKRKYDEMGFVPGKTVIVSPYAYSVRTLPVWFWDRIAKKLKEKGYQVYVNINEQVEVNLFSEMKPLFFSFDESAALLEYAGFFLGIRSGLCDIIALINKCKQIVLYPEEMKPIDYRVHRSDLIFSGFEAMGFCAEHIREISSPLISDIVSKIDADMTQMVQTELFEALEQKILQEF